MDATPHTPVPYILVPRGFDMISCGPTERRDKGNPLRVSRKLAERKLVIQDAMRVQARTSIDDKETIAKTVAEKLNRYPHKSLVKFIFPPQCPSSLSVQGRALYDPVADKTFVEPLRKYLDPEIKVIELNTDINHSQFVQALVEALKESLKIRRP